MKLFSQLNRNRTKPELDRNIPELSMKLKAKAKIARGLRGPSKKAMPDMFRTTGKRAKEIDKKAADLRLGNPKKYTALEEELEEAKGEKGDADPLDGERKKFDKDLDGIPDGGDPNPDDPDNPDAKKK